VARTNKNSLGYEERSYVLEAWMVMREVLRRSNQESSFSAEKQSTDYE
jgi:hypothetical protein